MNLEKLAARADEFAGPTNRANRTYINRAFRAADQSHLYPINNRFDVTERAIRKAAQVQRVTGDDLAGLALIAVSFI